MAVLLQAEFRRSLERLGRGQIWRLLTPAGSSAPKADDTIDELVDAVKELSQNRTGALIVLETNGAFDERDFSVPGVQLQAQVSKELIQTIFQTSTLLHDGAMLIQGASIASAGAILPLSDREASRQLGTRHRAAMGITERVENCLCVVVSEETGSISLAEGGLLNRPLTSSRLRELLQDRFSEGADRDVGPGPWSPWSGQLRLKSQLRRWFSTFRARRKVPRSLGPRALAGRHDGEGPSLQGPSTSGLPQYKTVAQGDRSMPSGERSPRGDRRDPACSDPPPLTASAAVLDVEPLPGQGASGQGTPSRGITEDQDPFEEEGDASGRYGGPGTRDRNSAETDDRRTRRNGRPGDRPMLDQDTEDEEDEPTLGERRARFSEDR